MDDRYWFDEIDLDPEGTWLRMGTRQLGGRPWLVFDDARERELGLKADLLAGRHDEVFALESDGSGGEAVHAAEETLGLVTAELLAADLPVDPPADGLHPLDVAGRLVQEDLCLLRPAAERWVLAGASLCFPSRWRLADKIGLPMAAVHGPVDGYEEVLARRVDTMLSRLGSAIALRRNWFVHPDGSLFQPDRPSVEPVIPAARCRQELHLRSERQTLRTLPETGWVLFTIRIQQAPLARFLDDAGRRAGFARFLADAPAAIATHRGLSPAQSAELSTLLA